MKISSNKFLKAIIVGVGLVAIFLAYRANSKKSASNDLFFAGASTDFKQTIPGSELGKGMPFVTESPAVGADSKLPDSGFLAGLPSLPSPSFEPVTTETLPAVPQWIDESVSVDADSEGETGVMQIVDEREQDAFEDINISQEIQQIPSSIDESSEAKVVNLEATPDIAPVFAPVTVALSDVAALKAVHHIEYGKSLARRNATEAAGQEFLGALRILAESNDMASGTGAYMSALRSGLQALKEAGDFKGDDAQGQISLNVSAVIEGHETRIISAREAKSMTAASATRRYLEFAGIQLGTCGGQNPVSAEALYCLGKMRTISAQADPDPESTDLYEAVIFQHAALTADPKNHRSANELGVLLARTGQLTAAETYLKNSLQIKQTPHGWANLAKVHQRKGTPEDQRLANLAISEYQNSLYQQVPDFSSGPIQLVVAQEFVARSPVQHPEAMQTHSGVPAAVVPASHVSDDNNPSVVQRIGSRIGSLFTPKTTR